MLSGCDIKSSRHMKSRQGSSGRQGCMSRRVSSGYPTDLDVDNNMLTPQDARLPKLSTVQRDNLFGEMFWEHRAYE